MESMVGGLPRREFRAGLMTWPGLSCYAGTARLSSQVKRSRL